ncbi:Electron transfer DM13 [Amycolatopsis marina]|uniref:Electron transfer DM13 n=1 Tax=Amycolatopsis marina TaxID=490629 RepID=A0A1I0W4S6_9PSEU|nr:DM13 domain-containing protein [Amycolatopsis marina]SFA83672.1 Electron transfer DM13 [Amycolatopsis marina]
MRHLLRRTPVRVLLATSVLAAVVALAVFEPWRAFTRSTADEPVPVAAAAPQQPRELAAGSFVSQEHTTSGKARVLELADGSQVLRLEGFSTSDGPDLHVWLTDRRAGAEWDSYDDGRAVRLGELTATDGNQNYVIPGGTGLGGLRSVVIWCDRFNVAFGSAGLEL